VLVAKKLIVPMPLKINKVESLFMLKRKLLLLLVFVYSQPVVGLAQKAQLLLFWSETCPGCIFYGSEIQQLQSKFGETADWTFVFPNLTSTDSSAKAYLLKNKLAGEIIVADAAAWVKKYAVEVTPEVVLLGSDGAIRYAGRIDNSYEKIGRRRHKATETELSDRLQKLADNQDFAYIRTRAVGCFLH